MPNDHNYIPRTAYHIITSVAQHLQNAWRIRRRQKPGVVSAQCLVLSAQSQFIRNRFSPAFAAQNKDSRHVAPTMENLTSMQNFSTTDEQLHFIAFYLFMYQCIKKLLHWRISQSAVYIFCKISIHMILWVVEFSEEQ